jgi:hypothetical protein
MPVSTSSTTATGTLEAHAEREEHREHEVEITRHVGDVLHASGAVPTRY